MLHLSPIALLTTDTSYLETPNSELNEYDLLCCYRRIRLFRYRTYWLLTSLDLRSLYQQLYVPTLNGQLSQMCTLQMNKLTYASRRNSFCHLPPHLMIFRLPFSSDDGKTLSSKRAQEARSASFTKAHRRKILNTQRWQPVLLHQPLKLTATKGFSTTRATNHLVNTA